MPLMTSSATSAPDPARPRSTAQAARGKTVSREPIRCTVRFGASSSRATAPG